MKEASTLLSLGLFIALGTALSYTTFIDALPHSFIFNRHAPLDPSFAEGQTFFNVRSTSYPHFLPLPKERLNHYLQITGTDNFFLLFTSLY